jgi:hypothetical protein
MNSQIPKISPNTSSTRRSFLKTAGAAGVALAGGLTAPAAFSGNEPESDSPLEQCGFTALPSGFIYLNSGTEGSMPECGHPPAGILPDDFTEDGKIYRLR